MDEAYLARLGPNAALVRELYDQYRRNPRLVDPSWAAFFRAQNGDRSESETSRQPGLGSYLELAAAQLVATIRRRGHLLAKVNPLRHGVAQPYLPEELAAENFGFSAEELKANVSVAGFGDGRLCMLSNLIEDLSRIYCGTIGFEYEHINDSQRRIWLRQRIESEFAGRDWYQERQRRRFITKMLEAELFDSELHRRYLGSKRFSLRGAETVSPMLDMLLDDAARAGVREIVLGMAHRGRMNILGTLAGELLSEIVADFEDKSIFSVIGFGDVKYHLGRHARVVTSSGGEIDFTIPSNPSHLESVNGVVHGMVRARQDRLATDGKERVLGVLVHGDAAFSAQGVVYESLNYSRLKGFNTGGTLHLVINNQVGFTTDPQEGRSSLYCTDVAKVIDAPIFHLNGEDVEGCCRAVQLAFEYRCRFGCDVVLDLVCYRQFGHNEGDDPSFTQPLMYAEINQRVSLARTYAQQLSEGGAIGAEEIAEIERGLKEKFGAALCPEQVREPGPACAVHGRFVGPQPDTAISAQVLEAAGKALSDFPPDFVPHPKVKSILERRSLSVSRGEGVDWGTAEALAFGSLVMDGRSVRLSGQDSGRGTFSQRHLELHDYKGGGRFYPLAALAQQARRGAAFELYNSPLSEAAVVAFEFGYASVAKESLVLWEAQFGDFVNCAQMIIDQYLTASEAKWGQCSGIVLLLPHGYEGQGPEHSSARLERFLHLAASGNMRVVCPSTAAQYFHLLRGQGLNIIKRPLVVMTPKSLLRSPEAAATRADFVSGRFNPVLVDRLSVSERDWQHIVFLTGKVFYDVRAALKDMPSVPVRIIRVEELYPFPEQEIHSALSRIKALSFTWVQEEHHNMGAFDYIEPLLRRLTNAEIGYVGRAESSSVAAGSPKWHQHELELLLHELRKRLT